MKPMLFMLFFLLVINALVLKTGTVLFTIGSWSLYSDAIFQTLYIAVRLLLMIMITTCLTATTKPLEMTLGIEDLLSPFQKIGLPSHEIAMLISIALRFIPDLIDAPGLTRTRYKQLEMKKQDWFLLACCGVLMGVIIWIAWFR